MTMCTGICSTVRDACKPKTRKILFYTALWVVFAGLVLHITGLSSPSWSTNPGNNNRNITTMGLWEECTRVECLGHDLANIRTVRAFAMIAMLTGCVGMVLLLCSACLLRQEDGADGNTVGARLLHIAIGAIVTTGVFIVISVILWDVTVHDTLTGDWIIGAGFALSLCGGLTMNLGVLMAYLGRGRGSVKEVAQNLDAPNGNISNTSTA